MTMRVRSIALLLCSLLAPSSGATPQPQPAARAALGYEKLRVTRVEGPSSLKDADTTQFLAADNAGHPVLLRGDTLEVFRLGADGSFDRRMGKLACKPSSASAYAAAMDPAGWTWAVSSPREVALCDFAKEQRPPGLSWVVSSLTYSKSGPLVAVTALGPPPDATNYFKKAEPRVFGLADDRWQPVVLAPILPSEILPSEKKMPADRLALQAELNAHAMEWLAEGKAESDALICMTAKSEIWLASWNSYRLQRVSASDKPEGPEREIVVGNGKVEWPKLAKEDQAREARDRKTQGVEAIPSTVGGAVPRGVVRGLVCGREIYLVVSTDEGIALDRFDPSQDLLERVLLDGITISSGPMTAALATDQLWLAGRFAADGLWRISQEDLARAHWKPVKNVKTLR